MGIIQSLQSKKGKTFMGYLYGWGASIVIVGAMFKIQHWAGASEMLVCGLTIEAIIFFFSAFEPVHEETDWSLVYPELRGMHDEDGTEDAHKPKNGKDAIAQELDRMLEEAKIGPELIESLGIGLKSLSEQAGKMSSISDASIATKDFVKEVEGATKNMNDLSRSYAKATASISEIANTNVDGQAYGEQLQQVSKNLSALNAVYELQLQSSSDHMKVTTKMYDGIENLLRNLQDSVQDTSKYKEEIGKLAVNLGSLNTVYGNMLSAMNMNKA